MMVSSSTMAMAEAVPASWFVNLAC
jgi:hypothetical protein